MQMFVAPIHEALDTKFLNLDKGMHSRANIKCLILLRAFVFTVNTLVTAAFPFMGDFVNLFGSFTLIPLTFIFPSMIFIKVRIGFQLLVNHELYFWLIQARFFKLRLDFSLRTGEGKDSKVREEDVALDQYCFVFSTLCSDYNFCCPINCEQC